MNKGKLYIVATPIGNLGDITYRAVEILNSVAFVLAEDTRESAKLFRHYKIKTQLISYRDQNHEKMFDKIREKLDLGLDLALISDSGTPNISDPGFKLVKQLRSLGCEVYSIPGASAVIAAASISGLPTDKFTYLGFLPKGTSDRLKVIKEFGDTPATLIIYESPNRLIKLLEEIEASLGKERQIVLCKDLTKLHEKYYRGTPGELISEISSLEKIYGEYVVLISKAQA